MKALVFWALINSGMGLEKAVETISGILPENKVFYLFLI